jgi:chromosome segregation ATPase
MDKNHVLRIIEDQATTIAQLSETIEVYDEDISSLEGEISNLEGELETVQSILAQTVEAHSDFVSDCFELQSQVLQKLLNDETTISDLREEVEGLNELLEDAQEEVESTEFSYYELTNEYDELEEFYLAIINDLENTLSETEQELAYAEEELEDVHELLEAETVEVNAYTSAIIDKLVAGVESRDNYIIALLNQMSKINMEKDSFNKGLINAVAKCDELRHNNNQLLVQNDELRGEINLLKSRLTRIAVFVS